MVKVSVIVPMYNVEDYVEQCLSSLERQTLKELEVIIVNDGSTDNSVEIAQGFVDRNSKLFKLVHKENGGLSDARNYGLQYVTGETIAFLDSDDYVEDTLYEKLYNKLSEGYDICVTDIEYSFEDKSKSYVMKGLSDWPTPSIQRKALLSPLFAWNKLYKASLFLDSDIRYPVGTWYEDIPVTTVLFAQCEDIGYLDECLIHYRQRTGSIMSSNSSNRVSEIFGVMAMLRDRFKQLNLSDKFHDELEYLHIEHLRLYGMFRFIRSNNWEKYYEDSELVMNTYYPNWKKNPYIDNLNMKNKIFLKFFNKATEPIFRAKIK